MYFIGLVGIMLPLSKRKRLLLFQRIVLITVLFMVIWRTLYQIESSRYASGLIYPFTLATSFFLVRILKPNFKINRVIILCLISLIAFLWIKKEFFVTSINLNINTIADIHQKNNEAGDCILIAPHNDAGRLKYHDSGKNRIEQYFLEQNRTELSAFVDKFKLVNYSILYDIVVKTNDTTKVLAKNNSAKHRQVLSLFTQKAQKKKHCVYLIEPRGSYQVLLSTDTYGADSGILQNGDLELLDSPEQSYEKLKKQISNYSEYYDYDPSIRTPVNAYFFNNKSVTQYRPFYSCTTTNAISGDTSAFIRINASNNVGYFLFYQRFGNGKYKYSFRVKGKKGTKVCLLYDTNQKKEWRVCPLVYFIIPNSQTYIVQSDFKINHLRDNDYFIVGAWVYNGEAYLDNFKLDRLDNCPAFYDPF